MFEVKLKLRCKNPKLVKSSLEPDIKNDKNIGTTIKTNKNFIAIEIKSEKLSHLKAVINSYISLVNMLEEVDKLE